MNTLANPATTRQESFINRLVARAASLEALNPDQADLLNKFRIGTIGKREASYLIKGLLTCPETPAKMAQPGYYKKGLDYLVVVENRNKTATYAKRLVLETTANGRTKARWVYAPGEAADVASVQPMTLKEAAKFGHMYGVCFVCCRPLTDPESVQRGIGPVCAKRV